VFHPQLEHDQLVGIGSGNRTKVLTQIWPMPKAHEKYFDNSEAFSWLSFLEIVMFAKPSSSCTSVTKWKSGAS
jgi:hypothetical protein